MEDSQQMREFLEVRSGCSAAAAGSLRLTPWQMEKQKAQFNELVSHITSKCFSLCVPKAPGKALDSYEQACLSQCALRFLESNEVVLTRLGAKK